MQSHSISLVTGANRGLGLETARQLAAVGHTVVLTSRNVEQGRAASVHLADRGLDVSFHELDVTKPESVHELTNAIRERFGRLDCLVNNAGVFLEHRGDGVGAATALAGDLDIVRKILETNLLGAIAMCQAAVPLMSGRGTIVNVSSGLGQLQDMAGQWPGYRCSKAALNSYTRALAAELAETEIRVNAVCPGWVRTDMGGPEATRSVEEGADTIVWAATLPADGPTGGFFRDRKAIPW